MIVYLDRLNKQSFNQFRWVAQKMVFLVIGAWVVFNVRPVLFELRDERHLHRRKLILEILRIEQFLIIFSNFNLSWLFLHSHALRSIHVSLFLHLAKVSRNCWTQKLSFSGKRRLWNIPTLFELARYLKTKEGVLSNMIMQQGIFIF